MRLFTLILCLFNPPAGVWLVEGCGKSLFINMLLSTFVMPGQIHAFYVFLKRREETAYNLAMRQGKAGFAKVD